MDKIFIGAAYYPELWDESEIEEDIQRCKRLGINTLRMGEFAWGRMEPCEGIYDFDWLEKIVDRLYTNGIYTIMCTPTCTPPRWMLIKYPQARMVKSNLQRVEVSARCHPCKTSPVMRKKNRMIVEAMAKKFSANPGVIGWQIDNEIYPYNDGCYCGECKKAFRLYLRNRYKDITNLNKRWGMARWSLQYSSFDEVEPPYPDEWRHPSLRKAWWDFQCNQIFTYVDEQAEILHKYGCKNVGTDMMQINSLDFCRTNENLDTVMYNHYDSAENLGATAFAYDFARCVKDKPFWVTETQVGWSGSEFAERGFRPVGNCYVNTWLPLARGAQANLYWLFRSHPNGHELAHGALFSTAGREYRVTEEVGRACKEIEKCEQFLSESKVVSKIALHYSASAEVDFEYAPIIKGINYRWTLIPCYHGALRQYNVDVIDPIHSLDSYQVVISPFLTEIAVGNFRERIVDWIKKGGVWIVGPMSDIYDDNLSKYTDAPFGFIEELAGVYTKYQKPLDNNEFKAVWNDGSECQVGLYYDAFEIQDGTESLAKYSKGEFAGLTLIAQREIGKGKIVIVGSKISHTDLLRLIDIKPIAEASDNVILTERSSNINGLIAIEVENKSGFVVLEKEYVDLISGEKCCGKTTLNAHQVMVLTELTETVKK